MNLDKLMSLIKAPLISADNLSLGEILCIRESCILFK